MVDVGWVNIVDGAQPFDRYIAIRTGETRCTNIRHSDEYGQLLHRVVMYSGNSANIIDIRSAEWDTDEISTNGVISLHRIDVIIPINMKCVIDWLHDYIHFNLISSALIHWLIHWLIHLHSLRIPFFKFPNLKVLRISELNSHHRPYHAFNTLHSLEFLEVRCVSRTADYDDDDDAAGQGQELARVIHHLSSKYNLNTFISNEWKTFESDALRLVMRRNNSSNSNSNGNDIDDHQQCIAGCIHSSCPCCNTNLESQSRPQSVLRCLHLGFSPSILPLLISRMSLLHDIRFVGTLMFFDDERDSTMKTFSHYWISIRMHWMI